MLGSYHVDTTPLLGNHHNVDVEAAASLSTAALKEHDILVLAGEIGVGDGSAVQQETSCNPKMRLVIKVLMKEWNSVSDTQI